MSRRSALTCTLAADDAVRRHRTYPIAYDKWIREQVVDDLALPELYERLPHLFEIARLESRELEEKGADLRALAETI